MSIAKGQLAEIYNWLQTDAASAAVAGAAGGLVRWMTLHEKPMDGAAALIVGSLCAIYLGPLVDPMLAPVVGKIAPAQDGRGFSSFVVGLGGIGMAGFVIETLRRFQIEKRAGPDDGPGDGK